MDRDTIAQIARSNEELHMLLLFGSRARGLHHEASDWDFGYIATKNFDDSGLYSDLVLHLKTDKVDLVNLCRANGLLRYRAAKDNIVVYEKSPGVYETFWIEAVHFWCDAGPLFRAEYEAILEKLG